MSAFDPYHRWLGIPPEEQPPHHYRLLGVALFESDLEVISQAADQRMAALRKVQIGPHGAESQRLLNEVATARRCLLSPQHRAAYDAQLRARFAPQTPTSPPLPPVGPPGLPNPTPLLTLGGPLQPPTMLPIGMAVPQPVPPAAPRMQQPVIPAQAAAPPDDTIDPLAEIASASDEGHAGEPAGRRSKARRAKRQTARSLAPYSLLLLAVSVAALGAVVWLRMSSRPVPLLAGAARPEPDGEEQHGPGEHAPGKTAPAAKRSRTPALASGKANQAAGRDKPREPLPAERGGPAQPPSTANPAAARPQTSAAPNSPGTSASADPNPSRTEGFRPLFNGMDLTGWRTHPAQPGAWRVEQGILTASGAGTTHLFSEREDFRNVVVRASMRVSRDSNGGIFVRASYGPKPPAPLPHGYEARIFGNKLNSGTLRCYAPNQIIFPSPKPIDQPDDWLTLEFRVVEGELTSLINGQEVCSATDPQRLFDRGLIAVQFRGPPNGTAASKIEFRSIEIKELPPEQQAQNQL